MIITIDGPAASGKGTVAQKIAEKLEFYYLNSGMLYRAFAYCLQKGYDFAEIKENLTYHYKNKKASLFFKEEEITLFLYSAELSQEASRVSKDPHIRAIINEYMKEIVKERNCIVEGRDIGSIVFPDADKKFFLTADITVRAQRILNDEKRNYKNVSLSDVIEMLDKRDKRDEKRNIAPLLQAKDAIIIDNSNLTIDETVSAILSFL